MVPETFFISSLGRACIARRLAFTCKTLERFRLRRMLRKAKPRILGNVLITDPRDGCCRRQPGVLPNEPRRQDGSGPTDTGKAMHQNPATPLELSFDERENDSEIRWRTEVGSLDEEILEPEFRWIRLEGLLEERDDCPDTLCAEEAPLRLVRRTDLGAAPRRFSRHQPLEARILKSLSHRQWLGSIHTIQRPGSAAGPRSEIVR